MHEMVYEELDNIISFEGFNFKQWFLDEKDILEPRLKKLGYTDIKWVNGEADSFGPLTRTCRAIDASGARRWFIYG